MAATVGELRTFGARRVSIRTHDGRFEGTILQDALGDHAIMLMLAPVAGSSDPIVIAIDAIDAIEEIVER